MTRNDVNVFNSPSAFAPAFELAGLIKSKEISPIELLDHLVQRIKDLNPRLNAYLTIAESEARSAARVAEKIVLEGAELPPLHGIPVAIKDLEYTKGIRTTGGSLAYRDFVPDEDALIVERLKRAGAIVLGKTNTPEFGSYGEVWNHLGDDCHNPWNLECTAGGSSGGSAAAVAAGLAPLATGTDGAGSIRTPAAFCGVYGFKPTFGLVPLYAGFLTLPLYTSAGPITRSVRDAALMLSVIGGHDSRDPNSRRQELPDFLNDLEEPIKHLRIAWSPDLGFAKIDPEVRDLTQSAARVFESLGSVVDEAIPPIDEDFHRVAEAVRNTDKYAAFGHLLETRPNDLTPYIKAVFEQGRKVTGLEYSRSLRGTERLKARIAYFFERYDLLLTPTTPVVAFPIRQPPQTIDGIKSPPNASTTLLTMPWNLTGQPAASLPCGFSRNGLPVGLQIIGRIGEDGKVLQASAAFEKVRPWANLTPACDRTL
jgi:aspartyl-tRNA(Asn)/glutamyl-tRNA(Gln) amidotransferase subunit A